MSHTVEVHQLRARHSRDVWMNVEANALSLGVWTNTMFKPTRLVQRGDTAMLIQFDSVPAMEEWVEENRKNWTTIAVISHPQEEADCNE